MVFGVISLQIIVIVLLDLFLPTSGLISENKLLEGDLLKRYDKRHRPVKKDSTTMNVQVFLMINHIERVDEKEQTMLLHGVLWAMWMDEYLTWNPSEYNETQFISIESWKLWQPTFALYNSARSNGWFVYMNGMPATVSSQGRVIGTGTFSFYVTCLFDFSNYPYDVQECPIVLADWMYDLSKINLSDSVGNPALNLKPVLRLSYDILNGAPKSHVAGWEMLDTWQKHCYWGPKGCSDETPFLVALDNYWSLLEFGIKIRRHAPYYGLTMVLPTMITATITLLAYWVEDLTLATVLCAINVLLQAFCGANLMRQLPPGNGDVPKIAKIYSLNLALTVVAYLAHVLIQYAINVLPADAKLPIKVQGLSGRLKVLRLFKLRGLELDSNALSFAPTDLKPWEGEALDAEQQHAPAALHHIDSGPGPSLIIDMEPVAGPSDAETDPPMVELDLSDGADGGSDAAGDEALLVGAASTSKWITKLKTAVKSQGEPPRRHISVGSAGLPGSNGGGGDDDDSAGGGVFNALFNDSDETPEPKTSPSPQTPSGNTATPPVVSQKRMAAELGGEKQEEDPLLTRLQTENAANTLHTELYVLRRLIFAIVFAIMALFLPFLLF